jgi:hypothetical protein
VPFGRPRRRGVSLMIDAHSPATHAADGRVRSAESYRAFSPRGINFHHNG